MKGKKEKSGHPAITDEQSVLVCSRLFLASLIILIAGRILTDCFPTVNFVTTANILMTLTALIMTYRALTQAKRSVKLRGEHGVLIKTASVTVILDFLYFAVQDLFGMDFIGAKALALLSVFFSLPVCYALVDICVYRVSTNTFISVLSGFCTAVAALYTLVRFLYVFVFSFLSGAGVVVFTALKEIMSRYTLLSLFEYILNALLFLFIIIIYALQKKGVTLFKTKDRDEKPDAAKKEAVPAADDAGKTGGKTV